eukprot:scaffold314429_cov32-Tisochrysis_lutea.AAC.1
MLPPLQIIPACAVLDGRLVEADEGYVAQPQRGARQCTNPDLGTPQVSRLELWEVLCSGTCPASHALGCRVAALHLCHLLRDGPRQLIREPLRHPVSSARRVEPDAHVRRDS